MMDFKSGKLIDYYDLLGIKKTAGPEEIKRAYRNRLKVWHPDHNTDRIFEAEEKTKVLNQAYYVLSDPERRKTYDRILRYTRGRNFEEILENRKFWTKLEKASPALKQVLEKVKDLYSLFNDSIRGRYKLHPATLGIVGCGLLYFVIPMDLIPDYIPFIGFLDDLAVLSTIINSIQDELLLYRNWKKMNYSLD